MRFFCCWKILNFCKGEDINDSDLYELMEEADKDGDGCLNFSEFYRIMKKKEDPLDDDSDNEWTLFLYLDNFLLSNKKLFWEIFVYY